MSSMHSFSVRHLSAGKNHTIVLIVFGLALLVLFAPIPLKNPPPQNRTIRIEASQYAFTPGEVRVNPGDQITVDLVSTDVVHGFSLDGHHVQITAEPGKTSSVTFTAGPAGVYRFRCSVACGNMHPFMIGKFRVGTNPLWIRGGILVLAVGIAALIRRNPSGATA